MIGHLHTLLGLEKICLKKLISTVNTVRTYVRPYVPDSVLRTDDDNEEPTCM